MPEWDSFTLTKIDDEHAVVIAGVQEGPGAVNDVYCLQIHCSLTTGRPEVVCKYDTSVEYASACYMCQWPISFLSFMPSFSKIVSHF